jgi:hypothetical protein
VEVQTGNFSLYPRYTPKGGINGWQGRPNWWSKATRHARHRQLAGRHPGDDIARVATALSREARDKVEAEVTAQAIARFGRPTHAKQFGFGGWACARSGVHGDAPRPGADDARRPPHPGRPTRPAGRSRQGQVTATVSGSVQLLSR